MIEDITNIISPKRIMSLKKDRLWKRNWGWFLIIHFKPLIDRPNNITFCFLINMKKIFILVLFISYIFSSCIRYDEKCLPYYLYSVTQKSDINYSMISKLDSFPIGRVKLKNEFYPVSGDYTVLRWLTSKFLCLSVYH